VERRRDSGSSHTRRHVNGPQSGQPLSVRESTRVCERDPTATDAAISTADVEGGRATQANPVPAAAMTASVNSRFTGGSPRSARYSVQNSTANVAGFPNHAVTPHTAANWTGREGRVWVRPRWVPFVRFRSSSVAVALNTTSDVPRTALWTRVVANPPAWDAVEAWLSKSFSSAPPALSIPHTRVTPNGTGCPVTAP